jgi:hypothetical protein
VPRSERVRAEQSGPSSTLAHVTTEALALHPWAAFADTRPLTHGNAAPKTCSAHRVDIEARRSAPSGLFAMHALPPIRFVASIS